MWLCPPCSSSPLGPHRSRQQGGSSEATKWEAGGSLQEKGRDGAEGRALLQPRGISSEGGKGGKKPSAEAQGGGKEACRRGGGEKNTHTQEYMAPWFSLARRFANTFMLHCIYVSVHFPGRCTRPRWQKPRRNPPKLKPMPLRAGGRGRKGCRRGLGFALGCFSLPRLRGWAPRAPARCR